MSIRIVFFLSVAIAILSTDCRRKKSTTASKETEKSDEYIPKKPTLITIKKLLGVASEKDATSSTIFSRFSLAHSATKLTRIDDTAYTLDITLQDIKNHQVAYYAGDKFIGLLANVNTTKVKLLRLDTIRAAGKQMYGVIAYEMKQGSQYGVNFAPLSSSSSGQFKVTDFRFINATLKRSTNEHNNNHFILLQNSPPPTPTTTSSTPNWKHLQVGDKIRLGLYAYDNATDATAKVLETNTIDITIK